MFKEIELLSPDQVVTLRGIAGSAPFVDGRISNPHHNAKQNLQLHDPKAYHASGKLMMEALVANSEFQNFAFPVNIAPPMMTRYTPGMKYGAHSDAAYIKLAQGPLRSDLSCTIFLHGPEEYEGGALRIQLGVRDLRFKGAAGNAIIYPSDTMHEVEPVTAGERLVAITFIQSRIADPFRRELLYEVNEVAALEGLNMSPENFVRLQLVQQRLLRHWGDSP